ncbi:bactofilin family protein [Edaphobacter aggregans]|uniref:bactofilin family protein n=1 Tax=Edaphobacter aggregans TaxID=570835 RepID=UPI00068C905D|nr:polymer-forming cytoskeletal protein [Edaphobacter aggregans]
MLDQRIDATPSSVPDPTRQVRPSKSSSSLSSVGVQSIIGKSLLIKGEITGSESVHIEGKIEGSIELPDDRVTVGRNGRVSANIAAQDIVVLGEVLGSCTASDLLNIRSEGSLYGDVVVSRISVEEGAYMTGSIDIRRESALEPGEHEPVESLHVN